MELVKERKIEFPTRKIKWVQFGVSSPEETKANSVALIKHVLESYENKECKAGGLSDPRLGCLDRDMLCYTCGETMNTCDGHFGHIELETPVYHIGFIKRVKKILECVCHKCSRFRLLPTDPKYKKLLHVKNRFDWAWNYAKIKTVCDYPDCETQLLPLRCQGISLYYDPKKVDKKMGKIPLTAEEARKILERISDETCTLIGLDPYNARPEWMILTVLPVPPPCVRPSVAMDYNGKGEDDLTHMLTNIIRSNILVKKNKNSRCVKDFKELLELHVTSYIDNDVSGLNPQLQKGGRPIKSLTARLKGKEGRLRAHLMGKRVDQSARTVITGDPNISIEEVGIPYSIAKTLTFPETVIGINIVKMQKLVNNSPNYPGAKFVIRESGDRINLDYVKTKPTLIVGDIVERHMIDGDSVLFNRQPTLHKMSMMCHHARIMSGSTFRMNVNVCASYNADFDGDEMNLHMPQSYSSVAELNELSTVSRLLVSSQSSKPVNGLVQDALATLGIFTQRETFLTREEVFQLCLYIKKFNDGDYSIIPQPCILKPVPLWTGKQIISMLLPRIDMVGYHYTNSDVEEAFKKDHPTASKQETKFFQIMTPDDTRVLIDDGVLISGIICKRTAGTSAGGIIHIIWNDYGPEVAKIFMDDCSQVLNCFMTSKGFSVGLGDGVVPPNIVHKIRDDIESHCDKVSTVLELYNSGKLIPKGNLSIEDTKEAAVQLHLAAARDQAGKTANGNLTTFNNLKQMVEAGSKGSILNICQVAANVGQQLVDGKRMPYGFRDRTLPHFLKFDDSPEARGFVRNSFICGLTPTEMFFHAMGGREGLIDTAVKTSECGYIQRRLVKALEDLILKYDGTVRNSREDIIQFHYGEDGMDGTAMESQTFPTMLLSDEEMEKNYLVPSLQDTEFVQLVYDRDFLRNHMRLMEDKWSLPINIRRMKLRASRMFPVEQNNKGEQGSANNRGNDPGHLRPSIDPKYVFEKVRKLTESLRPTARMYLSTHNPGMLFGILVQSVFASKTTCFGRNRISKEAFDWLMHEIYIKYYKSLVHTGECVGIIAAQSIGEPCTQMTLNTFHLAGTSNKTVTTGIPRLKELINVVRNMKTPSMIVYLKDDYRFDKSAADKIRIQVEHTSMSDLIVSSEIYFDIDYKIPVREKDAKWLKRLLSIPDPDMPPEDYLHPWVLIITLSREKMTHRRLSMKNLHDKMMETYMDDLFILNSSDLNDELVMHLRIYKDGEDEIDGDMTGAAFLEKMYNNLFHVTTVVGAAGIDKAFRTKRQCHEFLEDGSLHTKEEYAIETDGINIRDVLRVTKVDPTRIYCNDPQEMLRTFGIEVARACLMDEIRSVIESGGSHINYRHLALLCDVMTNRGSIMSITRHGMNKTDAGPLKKCTFEQTVNVFMDAAVNGETDDVKGVSENIMFGQLGPFGTGLMHVLLDDEMLGNMEENTVNTIENGENGDFGQFDEDDYMENDDYQGDEYNEYEHDEYGYGYDNDNDHNGFYLPVHEEIVQDKEEIKNEKDDKDKFVWGDDVDEEDEDDENGKNDISTFFKNKCILDTLIE